MVQPSIDYPQFRWEPKNISSAVYFVRLIIDGRTSYKKYLYQVINL
ncbi:MAG: hypothetical protein CM15mP64_3560 [Candidatus Neomarinimicrobiota bacterium]|nr:MAG: hypothetical protein CM15mP64_3560 [Candidatus Neomarinimicrobiota bacterium]